MGGQEMLNLLLGCIVTAAVAIPIAAFAGRPGDLRATCTFLLIFTVAIMAIFGLTRIPTAEQVTPAPRQQGQG